MKLKKLRACLIQVYICKGGDSMNDIVDLIVNNGIAVVVVAYFLFRDYKFNDELIKTLTTIQNTLTAVADDVIRNEVTKNAKK